MCLCNCEQAWYFYDLITANVHSLIEQPFKIPFVAAVALYGNEVKPEITIEAMKRVGDRAQEALYSGDWKELKLMLRFFACLQPLYQDDGIFTLLSQLFDTVVDLQSANENDVRLVYLFLFLFIYANACRSSESSSSKSSFSPSPTL
jgi:nuclear cap-binding protein subunit 1